MLQYSNVTNFVGEQVRPAIGEVKPRIFLELI